MFWNVFLELCDHAGVKPSNVADAIGIHRSSVTGWKRGSAPTDANLRRLASYFGVDMSVFTEEPSSDAVRIPVLGTVPAGIPIEAIEDITDYEEIPKSMTHGGKEYFALKVKGDSMFPQFMEGDVVIVRKQESCRSGDVCVVYVNGYDATLKQVRLDDVSHSMSLVPINTNYLPKTYTKAEIDSLPVRIAGVVVELRRKF